MKLFLNLFLVVLSSGGFTLAFYIFKSKREAKPMVCPLDGHCEEVMSSEYSKFFGVPVEILGMFYYAVVAIGYGFSLIYPSSVSPYAVLFLSAMTTFSFLFSLYLTFIQAFNLKKWCTWCLASAGISSFIFLSSLLTLKFGVLAIPPEFFEEINEFMLTGHLLSAAFGFGVAAISALLFLKFIKDFNISRVEADIMYTFTQVVWFSLFVFVLSGFGLYAGGADGFATGSFFLFKIITAVFLLISSAVFNLLMAPKLIKKSLAAKCDGEKVCSPSEVGFSIALNIISIFSWIFSIIFVVSANIF